MLVSPSSIGGSCVTRAGERRPRRPANRSSVVPCRMAETTTTKKTALKIVFALRDLGREHERREHDRHSPPEPCPPEEQPLAGGEVVERGRHPDRGGPNEEYEEQRECQPRGRDIRELTWEHEQAEHDEQRDLREERKSFVEADELPAISRRRAADGETHEVHGEEAATPDDVRSSEGQSSRGK